MKFSQTEIYYETLWREVKPIFLGRRGDGDARRSVIAYAIRYYFQLLPTKSCGKAKSIDRFPGPAHNLGY